MTGNGFENTQKVDWRNRLAKWRMVFTGWQLGTRSTDDPEAQAVRDHREVTMLLRAEVNALVIKLVQKGFFTHDEYLAQVQEESRFLCEQYEQRFPGFEATDMGMVADERIKETCKNWRP